MAGYFYNDNVNSGLIHTAAYTYDGVNRLHTAGATGNTAYSQTFTYDAYGNLNCAPSGPGCVAFSYNSSTNRINGYGYDQAGNVTNDGTYSYQWDAEAHLTAVYQSGNTISLNTYNALGQRVEDATQTSTTDEVYGAGGAVLGRFTGDSNSRSFVPFGGGLLAEYFCGGMIFDHPDEIGSLTTSTDCTGNTVNEKLFYPFGESCTGAAIPSLGAHQMFGKLPDYDAEIDQYNTLNRHYSPSGRWMSPDPGGLNVVHLDAPQTWNMYAYVANNPTTLTDPTGLVGFLGFSGGCMTGGHPGCQKSKIFGDDDALAYLNGGEGACGTQLECEMYEAQNRVEAAQQQQQEQKAEVGYGETSGLVPKRAANAPKKKRNPYDSSTWDPASAQQLQDARENIMDISERNKTVHKATAGDNPIEQQIWDLNMDAAKKSNGSMSGNYFFIRQQGKGRQHPSNKAGYGQGEPIRSYGPFRNVGGGDVPRGSRTFIDIYEK